MRRDLRVFFAVCLTAFPGDRLRCGRRVLAGTPRTIRPAESALEVVPKADAAPANSTDWPTGSALENNPCWTPIYQTLIDLK